MLQLRGKLQALKDMHVKLASCIAVLEQGMSAVQSHSLIDHPKQPLLQKLLSSLSVLRPVSAHAGVSLLIQAIASLSSATT